MDRRPPVRGGWVKLLTGVALLASALAGAPQDPGVVGPNQRKALVLGNADYPNVARLETPLRDARGIADVLRKLSFEVTLVENADSERIEQSLDQFLRSLRGGGVALFYYSGFAVQVSGENYILPVNYKPMPGQEIDYSGYSLRRVLKDLEDRGAGLTILILDASRENPTLRKQFPEPGLALMESRKRDTLVAFSAAPGKVVVEVPSGSLSLYSQALVEAASKHGLTLSGMFQEVKRRVSEVSQGAQIPAEMSTVVRDIYVNPRPPDEDEWERIRSGTNVALFEEFQRKYPGSRFAAPAAQRLEQIEWDAASARDTAALRAFLAKYPAGAHAAGARVELANRERRERIEENRRLVEQTLKSYREAFERRDLDQVRALRPGLTRDEVSRLQNTFRSVRSIEVDLQALAPPEVNEDGAQVRCRWAMRIRDDSGLQQAQPSTVVVRLRRAGPLLVIESINVAGN